MQKNWIEWYLGITILVFHDDHWIEYPSKKNFPEPYFHNILCSKDMEKKPDTIGIRYRLFYSLFNTQLFCNTKNMQKSNIERILSVYNFHKKRREEKRARKERKPQDSSEQYWKKKTLIEPLIHTQLFLELMLSVVDVRFLQLYCRICTQICI